MNTLDANGEPVKGAEAEDLRTALEDLIAKSDGTVTVKEMQAILDGVDARDSLAYLESKDCPICEGDGEVSHGSCGVPGCDHCETCALCKGKGKALTIDELRAMAEENERVKGDLYVAEQLLKQHQDHA